MSTNEEYWAESKFKLSQDGEAKRKHVQSQWLVISNWKL